MEKRPAYETNPQELAALRKRLGELASDIPGTLAKLAPEVQREYREAEQSVIHARLFPIPNSEVRARTTH